MRITTTTELPAAPERVFRLLYDSKLPLAAPLLLRFGAPAPRACRLVAGRGVGAHRQCVTSAGAIDQRITEWREGEVLAFEMVHDGAQLQNWVSAIRDRFTLTPCRGGTRLTRRSDLEIAGMFRPIKALLLAVAIKKIHRFVFENWRQLLGVSAFEEAPAER